MLDPIAYLAVLAFYLLGHAVGDILGQWHHIALAKGEPGRDGVKACAVHVLVYIACQAWILTVGLALLGIEARPGLAVAGLAVSAATHYAIDRGPVLVWIAAATGSAEWIKTTAGRLAYDQTLHVLVLFACAAVTVAP